MQASHANALLRWNGSANAVLTIPTDAAASLPDGFTVSVVHRGAATYKISYAAPGVTVTQVNPVKASIELRQNRMATFVKDGANTWIATGGFEDWS